MKHYNDHTFMLQVLFKETLNRAILAGSIIVGIAVMMSISTIAPAFAASPWKDLWLCANTDKTEVRGTFDHVDGNDCGFIPAFQAVCNPRVGVDGHQHFFDKNGDGEQQVPDEKFRCVRDHQN